jgi:hypothetical protein
MILKLITSLKYCKIWKMEIIVTIILTKNWENIKTIIKETKQQLTEKDESTETIKNRWYDEECKIAIEEMKKP